MTLESLLLTTLFVLTAVAFIGVLNAQGLGRTIAAALLALFCLGASLWKFTEYRAARRLALLTDVQTARPAPVPESATPTDAFADAAGGFADDPAFAAARIELLAAVVALRDSLAAENPTTIRALSDSAYQQFESRAAAYASAARRLRAQAVLVLPATSDAADASAGEADPVGEALRALDDAARALQGLFRAVGRDEERARLEAFTAALAAADAALRRAGENPSSSGF